jgi:energy-converting hydrogenase Eha subunit F
MRTTVIVLSILALLVVTGMNCCTLVSANRVFPKLAPAWSAEAKQQREYDRQSKRP